MALIVRILEEIIKRGPSSTLPPVPTLQVGPRFVLHPLGVLLSGTHAVM
jgi:hypothetical protein